MKKDFSQPELSLEEANASCLSNGSVCLSKCGNIRSLPCAMRKTWMKTLAIFKIIKFKKVKINYYCLHEGALRWTISFNRRYQTKIGYGFCEHEAISMYGFRSTHMLGQEPTSDLRICFPFLRVYLCSWNYTLTFTKLFPLFDFFCQSSKVTVGVSFWGYFVLKHIFCTKNTKKIWNMICHEHKNG